MRACIRYCNYCRVYTMKERCKVCGRETMVKKPPRFSPQDRYGKYRRWLKRMEKGLV